MTLSPEDKRLLKKLKERFADWNPNVEYIKPIKLDKPAVIVAKQPEQPFELSCQYCGRPTKKVSGNVIYPRAKQYHDKFYYLCRKCDAYVGCHPDGKPMGEVADSALRRARIEAHTAFDRLWKGGRMTRSMAYSWLSRALDIQSGECHIGKFDLETCIKVVKVCNGQTTS